MSDINPYQSPATPVAPMESLPDGLGRLDEAAQMLAQTRPWVRFLSVLGFIVFGCMLIALAAIAAAGFQAVGLFTGQWIVIAIGGTVLGYLIPSILLWNYANGISRYLNEQTPTRIAAALAAQKMFWKYVGIAGTIVLLYGLGARLFTVLR